MQYQEADEMTDAQIKLRYGALIESAAIAFSVDASYAADIAKKAKQIESRKTRKDS